MNDVFIYNMKVFTDPIKNLNALGLAGNEVVADLGAGTGYYSLALGRMLPRGKVYAVELQRDFLDTIKNKVRDERLPNVEIIWGNVEKIGGTKIGDSVVNAVVASNLLFQLEDREKFIQEVKRILKLRGRILLVDWTPDGLAPKGSISGDEARGMFERAGFVWQRNVAAGEHHYGMILMKINE